MHSVWQFVYFLDEKVEVDNEEQVQSAFDVKVFLTKPRWEKLCLYRNNAHCPGPGDAIFYMSKGKVKLPSSESGRGRRWLLEKASFSGSVGGQPLRMATAFPCRVSNHELGSGSASASP